MKYVIKALLGLGLLAGVSSTAALAADYTPEPVVTASNFYIRGDLGWSWLDTVNNNDGVFLLGGGLGYKFNENLRTDARVDYAGVGSDNHEFGSVLGNVYFDIPTNSIVTPYVGAGLGYGWSDDRGDNESGVTYALMAGVEVNLTDNLSADVGYRFRQIIDSDTYANEALVGLRYSF
ncbi:outer membrane beta-barrel protein [Aestuariivirga sp.]|uniref:outer membrane protein n=1 Tax=Aestuariivirga sp. TaxID=2650926 RepID=UPI0025BE6FB2|nr:outer membrane beta-barrel protein [Aestuariivirga sp.]MCA3554171.1 porin family protein [Aestuariivirga sp.]